MVENKKIFDELYEFVNSNKSKKNLTVSIGEDETVEGMIYEHTWPIEIIKKKKRKDCIKLVLSKL